MHRSPAAYLRLQTKSGKSIKSATTTTGIHFAVADALSRIDAISMPTTLSARAIADEQTNDVELKNLIHQTNSSSLKLHLLALRASTVNNKNTTVHT